MKYCFSPQEDKESIGPQPHKVKKLLEVSPRVVDAIMDADMIILGPGSLYTSILPNLMIKEIGEAIVKTNAQVIYIFNIMTQLIAD